MMSMTQKFVKKLHF